MILTCIASKSCQWSDWTKWSACSRPCGGGAAYRLRQCVCYGVLQQPCHGEGIVYKICNTQVCQEKDEGFREKQCAAYNNVPYNDIQYRWRSYHEPSDPCALRCRPINDTFTVMLAPKVLDGTRCNDHSPNICINGKCYAVGCDYILGSNKMLDKCGICGGDGSSCSPNTLPILFSWKETGLSECSVTCGIGYRTTAVICINHCHKYQVKKLLCINISKPEIQILSCKKPKCQPYWITEKWEDCSSRKSCDLIFRKVHCVKEINLHQRVTVADHLCKHNPKPKTYKRCQENYCSRWYAGLWSMCSVTCGNGHQFREVLCRYGNGKPCNTSQKPPTNRKCNTGIPCMGKKAEINTIQSIQELKFTQETRWNGKNFLNDQSITATPSYRVYAWGRCSATCGEGIKSRLVVCQVYLDYSSTVVALDQSECVGRKPEEVSECKKIDCSKSKPQLNNENPLKSSYNYSMSYNTIEHIWFVNKRRKSCSYRVCSLSFGQEYFQIKRTRKVDVYVLNGTATIIFGTTVLLHCPVLKQYRKHIKWHRSVIRIAKAKRVMAVVKKGVLRIRKTRFVDTGQYSCQVGNDSININLRFYSIENADKLLQNTKQYLHIKGRGLDMRGYHYMPLPWSACSHTCGGKGLQTRNVTCQFVSHVSIQVVDKTLCEELKLAKPLLVQVCGRIRCPNWELGTWPKCPKAKCVNERQAIQIQTTWCTLPNRTILDDNYCNRESRPINRKLCINPRCIAAWSVEDWSACSVSCGGNGFRTRNVTCVWASGRVPTSNHHCRYIRRPRHLSECHMPSCQVSDIKSTLKDCKDQSRYCNIVKILNMCKSDDYTARCCHSCNYV